MKDYRTETLCIQGGYQPQNGEPRVLPIYQSTTYKAESFRMLRRILKHPEVLETPPTEFPEDEWI